jgi:alanine racemase
MQPHPNSVLIDLRALVYNLKQIRGLLRRGTRLAAVVKSDAYGHGLVPISRTLEKNGVDALAVAHLDEALELRDAGIRGDIILLSDLGTRESCEYVVEKGLTPVIYSLDTAERLNQAGRRRRKRIDVYLKVDTGMGRLGICHKDVAGAFDRFSGFDHLALIGLTSHLSTADDPDSDFVHAQRRRFERIVSMGRARELGLRWNNISNSAGTAVHQNLHFDMVRCGIMLYGGLPHPDFKSPVPLKPVMHFRARVLQLRVLEDRTPVSYGRTHYTEGDRQVAVISSGYGNGIPRRLSNRGVVLVEGKRVPIVGTICMNLTLCDVTDIPHVRVGDEVVMLGSQGTARITGDDMARWAETISYEVFCSIGQMNQKEYRE